jgi:alpha-glucoside transport system substrate-binding protein
MRNRKSRARVALATIGALTAFATAGCLQDPNAGGGGSLEAGGFADNASGDNDGAVQILGAFGGAEAEGFEASLAAFEEDSGIDVEYVPDTDFTTTILQRVGSGQAPDIGLFPQPGGLLQLAAEGSVQPIDTFLDYDAIDKTLIPGFLEAARLNGRVYGAPMRMAVKSLVWYPKPGYKQTGQPEEFASLQDLQKAADAIKAEGTAPWCMGWFSDQATGWVGTDWIEEYVLRLHGPDVYDEWVNHEIPFNDERIVEAFDAFGELARTEGNVFGGSRGVLNTPFGEAMYPAFRDNPDCYYERQGNFATGFFPAPVQENLDESVGVFVFPPWEGGYEGQPILGGGDLAASFNGDDDDTAAVMEFLTSDQFGAEWAQAGGWLSPHKTFDGSNYPNETTRTIAEIASNADVFRFDASDLMPKEVGSGTFWFGMVDWMQGTSSEDVATEIENSWPTEEEGSES